MGWKTALNRLGYRAETRFDELRHNLKQRLGYHRRPQIVAYNGYGTAERLTLQGRVLEDRGALNGSADTVWQNLLAAYRRFESDELPNVNVRAEAGGAVAECVTDQEGYFQFTLRPDPGRITSGWQPVALSLPQHPQPMTGRGEVLIPPEHCQYGVISDIDDTIMVTNATRLLTMIRLTFLESPRSRLPFDGVAAFYQALRQGVGGGDEGRQNPLFYVSSSPWNLYDFLVDFMRINRIPRGPLLLRDLGLELDRFIKSSHEAHKTEQIEAILDTYPDLPFLLIGDSGQHDAAIYQRIAAGHPGRIAAIYIRDLGPDGVDHERATQAARQVDDRHDGPLLLVKDSLAAAKHAAALGLIDPAALAAIGREVEKDRGQAETGGVELLLDE